MKTTSYKKLREILLNPKAPHAREFNVNKFNKCMKVLNEKIPIVEWKCYFTYSSEVMTDSTVELVVKHRRHGGDPSNIYSPKWYKKKLEGKRPFFS
jgi:hypothetical protein